MSATKIIDVSKWQGNIDWAKAKSEVGLAIIRIQDGKAVYDEKAERNIEGCQKNKIPYGVYAFFRAKNAFDAVEEMKLFLNRTKASGGGAQFYVIDCETESLNRGSINAAVKHLLKEKVKVGVYFAHHLYPQFGGNYGQHFTWIPRYGNKPKYPCDLWQHTSEGKVAGIAGKVDMNTTMKASKPLSWFQKLGKPERKNDMIMDCWWVMVPVTAATRKTAEKIAGTYKLRVEMLNSSLIRIHVRKSIADKLISDLAAYPAFKGKMRLDDTYAHSYKNSLVK